MPLIQSTQSSAVDAARYAAPSPAAAPGARHVGYMHSLEHLADSLPGKQLPPIARAALPGEGVLAKHAPGGDASELLSFGAKNEVVLSIYDARTQKGAVVHFDNNVSKNIQLAVNKLLQHVEETHPASSISASIFGGAWVTTHEDIGGAVRAALADKGITPTWDHWSFSMCLEHLYGVALDLSTGNVTVFEHSADLPDAYFKELLQGSSDGQGAEDQSRAKAYERRNAGVAVYEDRNGVVHASEAKRGMVTNSDIKKQQFFLRHLGTAADAGSETKWEIESSAASGSERLAVLIPEEMENFTRKSEFHRLGYTAIGPYREVQQFVSRVHSFEDRTKELSAEEARNRLKSLADDAGLTLKIDSRRRAPLAWATPTNSPLASPAIPEVSTDTDSDALAPSQPKPRFRQAAGPWAQVQSGNSSTNEGARNFSTLSGMSLTGTESETPRRARPFGVEWSAIHAGQAEHFSEAQEKIVQTVVDNLRDRAKGRAHPVYVTNFAGQDAKDEIREMFGTTTSKLYSTDLPNWDSAGKGRGAWRLVFKPTDGGVGLLGVYDTHQQPYVRWNG